MANARRNIVYLDDHRLFTSGVCKAVDPEQNKFLFQVFHHPDEAMHYIETCMELNTRIDLVLSDQNHPGREGLDFAVDVKELANQYGKFIPFMLLSMVVPQPLNNFTKPAFLDLIMQCGEQLKIKEYQFYSTFIEHLETGVIQSYLGKDTAAEIIVSEIERLSSFSPLF